MTDPVTIDDIQLLIHSGALFDGVTKGFGLIFTDDRIIGSKRFTEQHLVETPPLDPPTQKLAAKLLEDPTFDVPFSELQSVEVKSPSKFRPGAFVFHTPSGARTVKIGGTFMSKFTGVELIGDLVADVIERFAPGKLRR